MKNIQQKKYEIATILERKEELVRLLNDYCNVMIGNRSFIKPVSSLLSMYVFKNLISLSDMLETLDKLFHKGKSIKESDGILNKNIELFKNNGLTMFALNVEEELLHTQDELYQKQGYEFISF